MEVINHGPKSTWPPVLDSFAQCEIICHIFFALDNFCIKTRMITGPSKVCPKITKPMYHVFVTDRFIGAFRYRGSVKKKLKYVHH